MVTEPEVATCRDCGQPIRWVRTVNNRFMPLDPEPTASGRIVMRDGAAVTLHDQARDAARAGGEVIWRSHFHSCPAIDSGAAQEASYTAGYEAGRRSGYRHGYEAGGHAGYREGYEDCWAGGRGDVYEQGRNAGVVLVKKQLRSVLSPSEFWYVARRRQGCTCEARFQFNDDGKLAGEEHDDACPYAPYARNRWGSG